ASTVSRLGHVELMDNLPGDFTNRAHFRVYQHVSLAIKRFSRSQQFANSGKWVGFFQQWAVLLVADALADFFGRCPKANDERMSFEARQVRFVGRKAAARRNDRLAAAG